MKDKIEKVKKWAKRKAASLAISLANVEKNSFAQNGEPINISVNQERRHTQGRLADALINGEVTQEVMNLRWRHFKILNAVEAYESKLIGYDENGEALYEQRDGRIIKGLSNISVDPADAYSLEMSVDNTPITLGITDKLESLSGNKTASDSISATNYSISEPLHLPIKVIRKEAAKFNLEKYTKKLHIRKIDENSRLLEFYVSVYPDYENRTSILFISDVKKAIKNPMSSTILNIDSVEFITDNTIGAANSLRYKYNDIVFDKITEFNGHYLIKFIAKIEINGEYIFEKYRVEDLDMKYDKKEKKKTNNIIHL